MGSRVPEYSSKRRGLVGFSFALSVLLAVAVIYQKFLLDTSSDGAGFDSFPTAAARLKTFFCSEESRSTTAADLGDDENEAEHQDILPTLSSSTTTSSHNNSSLPSPGHSCLSRQESKSYQNPSPHKPSPYLLSQLRSYELLHRQCGPYTSAYNQTITSLLLLTHNNSTTTTDPHPCRYLIWTPTDGLGNQIISLASTFLYAILTRRILLVNFGPDISNLFCEPFPHSSWLLPSDFPHLHNSFRSLKTLETIILENNTHSSPSPSILYIDLHDITGDRVKHFHCDHVHALLHRIPVLILRSNLYYAPTLFMTPSFSLQLSKMFPKEQKTLVFHHLGRYLLNPSDSAWTKITNYYNTHLSHADLKLGLQIRVFWYERITLDVIMHQILSCTQKHNLLPKTPGHDYNKTYGVLSTNQQQRRSSKAVLVASLKRDYMERLMLEYNKEEEEEVRKRVRLYQMSSDEKQRFNNRTQNMNAWVEMYLLSLCDELVTTGQSTFGYVAQGLGGLKPVVLRIGDDRYRGADMMCYKAGTSDPCFMVAPRGECEWRRKWKVMNSNVSTAIKVVKVCEDRTQGVRLSE